MTREAFIGLALADCVRNNVSVKILQKKSIQKCGGWFCSNPLEMVCAYKARLGFEILIHEYNHFLQWKDDNEFWVRCGGNDGDFHTWLMDDSFKLSKKKVDICYNQAVELERDCEIRSIQMIKDYALDVDVEKYTKEANAYLYVYHECKKLREWNPYPIYTPKILEKMPNVILPLECYQKSVDINGKRVHLKR